jgi:TolA-binding protein/predicted Zn-dependent protease
LAEVTYEFTSKERPIEMKNAHLYLLVASLLVLVTTSVSLASPTSPYYQQALKAYQQGAYAQAVQYAKKASQTHGASPDTVFLLGLIATKQKNYNQAEAYFDAVLKTTPPDSELARKARHNRGLVTRLQLRDDAGLSQQKALPDVAKQGKQLNLALMQQADGQNLKGDDNYLTLAINQGNVVRWSAEAMPLKVAITTAHAPVQADALVRQALATWQKASGGKVSFVVVTNPAQADINLSWAKQLTHNRLGVSPFEAVGNRITKADVTVATHDPVQGQPLDRAALGRVILHELGHALGLHGHSANPQDVMYFSNTPQTSATLTARDVKTLGLLYTLTPDITNDTHTASVADSRTLIATLRQLQEQLNQKAYSVAYTQAVQALKRYPTHPDVLFVAGVSQHALGNKQQAQHYYQQVLKQQPNHQLTLENLKLL